MKTFLIIQIVFLFLSCTNKTSTGTSDDVDTGIVANLYYTDGAIAANARVRLFVTGDTSKTPVEQTETDKYGVYTFDNVQSWLLQCLG